jgi:3-deoxy-manno-octulosonate cytidylyltransferase (CMP-KDO synthetase)
MIQHVWERCSRAKGIARVIVATEDKRVATACEGFGAECVMTSAKCVSGTDRAAEVAARNLSGFTHVINVQGDEPLVAPATITKLARALTAASDIQMITCASAFQPGEDLTNPNAVKVVMARNGDALYFSRSVIPFARTQAAGLRFYRHQGIYGYTLPLLLQFVKWKPTLLERAESLEQLRALENGAKIRVVLVKHPSVGVDTPADAADVIAFLSK